MQYAQYQLRRNNKVFSLESCSGHQRETEMFLFFCALHRTCWYAVAFLWSAAFGTGHRRDFASSSKMNEKAKSFFLLYLKFGHNLVIFSKKMRRGAKLHPLNIVSIHLQNSPSTAALATLSAYSSKLNLTYLQNIVSVLCPLTLIICETVNF